MRRTGGWALGAWGLLLGLGCGRGALEATAAAPGVPQLPSELRDYFGYAVADLPTHFATGDVAEANNTPAENPITNAGATLGRVLFYDKRLSHNNSTACASCHQQAANFDDPEQFSTGFEGGLTGRHSTPLANAAYYARGRMFWDERAASLEEQVLMPIQDATEMGTNLDQLREELAATDFYPKLFEQAFGSSEVTDERISQALSQFVRSMVSYQSKFDQAVAAGTPDDPNFAAVFTQAERRGAQIFHGTGGCSGCHGTNAQVMDRPHNIGLDADSTDDPGAGRGEFKAMSLRNIAASSRFMHDGRFESLEEVIEHYSTGILDNPNLSRALRSPDGSVRLLNLNATDKQALVAFLNTLTDEAFLTSDLFSDPFVDLPGDYDGNGLVNVDDYTAWKRAFASGDDLLADGNLDGLVNLADYAIWRDNLGRTWEDLTSNDASFATAARVPEPSAAVLLIAGLAGFAAWRVLGGEALRGPPPS